MPRPSKNNLLENGRRTVIDDESDTVRRILDAQPDNLAAAVSSGSFAADGMVVAPAP